MKDKGQGIVLDEKGQEQPRDKERARKTNQTEPGRTPHQPVKEDDELQPLREKSGFSEAPMYALFESDRQIGR